MPAVMTSWTKRGLPSRHSREQCGSEMSFIAPENMVSRIYIGTAGWSIPRASAHRFDELGTHLERYARGLRCAEINSSFHRSHAPATYAGWRESTPPDFRFAVKVPRAITHDLKLRRARAPFVAFLEQTDGLAEKR